MRLSAVAASHWRTGTGCGCSRTRIDTGGNVQRQRHIMYEYAVSLRRCNQLRQLLLASSLGLIDKASNTPARSSTFEPGASILVVPLGTSDQVMTRHLVALNRPVLRCKSSK